MQDFTHEIKPGVGLGPILLGSTEDDVRALLGDPPEVNNIDYGDGANQREWEYEQLGISLGFSEDMGYKLDRITTTHDMATLEGSRVVGLPEAQLLESNFGRLGPPQLDEDFDEQGRDYGWEAINLSCWVHEGNVDSVTIMPLYDPSGEIPQWPNAGKQ